MFKNLWMLTVLIKIVLLGILTYFVQRLKKSINLADAKKIGEDVKSIEIITYLVVLFNYGLFIMKYIKIEDSRIESMKNYCGISYINLSLVMILLASVYQTRSTLSDTTPVPVSKISDSFKLMEMLTYALLGFNIVTHSAIVLFDKDIKFNISPKSFSFRRKK